jgi:hypothetical protein
VVTQAAACPKAVVAPEQKAKSMRPKKKALTPALSHPMGEGEAERQAWSVNFA